MPTESHVLGFDKNELFEALRDYRTNTGRQLPADAGNVLISTQDGEVRITLTFPDESAIDFTENEVGAALIMFCIKKRIPMARRATKSLVVADETLSLHLRIEA